MLERAAKSPVVALAAILALAAAVHIPGLTVWFQSDDFRYLAAVRHASAPTYVRQAFDFRHTGLPTPGFLGHYRPLYLVFWLVRYRLFGMNVLAYQLASLALHGAVIVLTWWIARRVSGRVLTAHLAALVMALHPAFTRSVIWVAASTDMEVTIAMLGTLALFLAFVDGGRRAWALYVASLVAYASALCLHPKAIALVAAIAGVTCLRSAGGLRELLRPGTLALLAPFAVMGLIWAAIQQHVQQDTPELGILYGFGSNNVRDFLGYAAVAAVPLWRDIWNPGHFLPVGTNYTVLALGTIVVADVIAGLVLLVRSRHRDAPVALFAAAWFTAMVLPLTSFKLGTVDRDLYVAGPAWALLIGVAGSLVADAVRSRAAAVRSAAVVALAAAVVLASAWTIRYERQFPRDERALKGFTEQMQAAYPTLPPGTQLYLVPASLNLIIIAPLLPYIVTTYYPGVEATFISADEATRREPTLAPRERILRLRE